MKKLTEKKYVSLLVYLCAAIYFVSYITRINYAAVLVEITKSLGVSKASASLALTLSAVSYGVGQLISGYLGDKFKAWKIILSGLICTTLMNLLIPFCPNTSLMAGVWFVNGFAQAMMWPPIVKIMSSMLSEDAYKAGCIRVSQASSLATILIYVISPVIILTLSWKYVFIFAATLSILMCFLWVSGFKFTEKQLKEVEITNNADAKESTNNTGSFEKFTPTVFMILAAVMVTIILQGALRDGVANWMPTYVSETFNLGSEISIFTNIALPIFTIVCFQIASWLNRKVIKNEFLCTGVTYGVTLISALLLAFFGQMSVAVAIFAAALLNGATHGVNYFQTCLIPIYFSRYGKVSFISGLLNSCTYIGSAVSTFGIAVLTESFTWSEIALVWALIAAIGMIISFVIVKVWEKFKKG